MPLWRAGYMASRHTYHGLTYITGTYTRFYWRILQLFFCLRRQRPETRSPPIYRSGTRIYWATSYLHGAAFNMLQHFEPVLLLVHYGEYIMLLWHSGDAFTAKQGLKLFLTMMCVSEIKITLTSTSRESSPPSVFEMNRWVHGSLWS